MSCRVCAPLVLSAMFAGASATSIDLLAWSKGEDATHEVYTVNDPVMGGGSVSTFSVDEAHGTGVWKGEVKIVSFLGSPGFCTMRTKDESFPSAEGTDAVELRLKSWKGLANYSVNVGIRGVTTDQTVYAAHVDLSGHDGVVRVPWHAFRLTFRGEEVPGPPIEGLLSSISRVGLSTSGVAGAFEVELAGITAVSADI